MAATKQQGQKLVVFLVGLTVTCAGIATFASAGGKAAVAVGLALLLVSFWSFLKLKPFEGKVALRSQPAGMKLLGAAVTVLGWLVVLFGLHLTAGVAGRMILAIVGLAISLAGVAVILPAACNKNAIWKA